jgi:hypothetical protein
MARLLFWVDGHGEKTLRRFEAADLLVVTDLTEEFDPEAHPGDFVPAVGKQAVSRKAQDRQATWFRKRLFTIFHLRTILGNHLIIS